MFKPFSNFLTDRSKTVLFGESFLLFVFSVCVCYTELSVSCSLVVTCWERADPLAILCEMLLYVFVTLSWVRCGIFLNLLLNKDWVSQYASHSLFSLTFHSFCTHIANI